MRTTKRIKDFTGFDIMDPIFFQALSTLMPGLFDGSYQIVGMGYITRSGDKHPTSLMETLYEKDPAHADALLAQIIKMKYGHNWTKLKEALISTNYDPIENYDKTEEYTDTQTTTFGKTIDDDTDVTFGKKIDDDSSTTFGKKVDDDTSTTFGKKIDDDTETTFGKKIDDDTSNTYGKTVTTDDDHTNTYSGSETDRHQVTEDDTTVTPGITTTVEGDVYGYNSSTSVPSDKKVERRTGHDDQTHTLDETTTKSFTNRVDTFDGTVDTTEGGSDSSERNYEESGTEGSQRDYAESGTEGTERDYAESGTEGTKRDYEESGTEGHARDYREGGTEVSVHEYQNRTHGNIGTVSTQQMLQSEIELRQWVFLDQVYSDIDKEIALQTY